MRVIKLTVIAFVFAFVAATQSPEPPIDDSRLTVHTLVREDIFAGFLTDNMQRFARGEKNIDLLLEKRPTARAELLAWKGGAALYRAVRAHEDKQDAEFKTYFQQARDHFSEALKLQPGNGGVAAVTGGSYVILADRLPEQDRAAAWEQAYSSFQILWKQQAPFVKQMPLHIKGELLGGLAQSAQRTGRTEELAMYLDKILEVLPNTPYEPVARQWKKSPESASDSSITCLSCHDAGRLSARLGVLNSK